MTDLEKLETKNRILKVAGELFAKFGFSGTSIRDIATACDVNLAAINYHFGSKHNLYWSVTQDSHQWLDSGLYEISLQVNNMEEMMVKAYDLLMSDKDVVRSALKIMLTDGVPEPDGELREAMEATMGPPGADHLARVLKKQLGDSVSDSKILFAVHTIFGNLIHFAMISSCCKIEALKRERPELRPEGVKELIRLHSKAICEFISKD